HETTWAGVDGGRVGHGPPGPRGLPLYGSQSAHPCPLPGRSERGFDEQDLLGPAPARGYHRHHVLEHGTPADANRGQHLRKWYDYATLRRERGGRRKVRVAIGKGHPGLLRACDLRQTHRFHQDRATQLLRGWQSQTTGAPAVYRRDDGPP